jgi:hypothetical protein
MEMNDEHPLKLPLIGKTPAMRGILILCTTPRSRTETGSASPTLTKTTMNTKTLNSGRVSVASTGLVRHSLPAVCGKCGKRKRGFWEVEYEMDCTDCREEESRLKTEERLRKAFAAGEIKESQLTPLGRSICLPNKLL